MVAPLSRVLTTEVQQNGTLVGIRPIMNYSGTGVVVSDDSQNNRINININTGLANAYSSFVNADGSQFASAIGSDTFRFKSTNNTIDITITDNGIDGDSIDLKVINNSSIQKSIYVVGNNSSVRQRIDFIGGPGIKFTISDDSVNDRTQLQVEQVPRTVNQLIEILHNDNTVGIQGSLNFTTGPNLSYTMSEDSVIGKININLSLAGGIANKIVKFTGINSIGDH